MESKLEKDCKALCAQYGFGCHKLTQPGHRGWPDLMVTIPGKPTTVFFELKRPGGGGVVAPHQEKCAKELRALGYTVFVGINSYADFKQHLIGCMIGALDR